jgi:hypothetical protein
MRNFDLQLAIATLRLPALSFMSRLERIRTIPVVYGGNRADPFLEEVRRRAAGLAHALAPIGRYLTARESRTHQRPSQSQARALSRAGP